MIALDTNILIYASRPESVFHRRAVKLITDLAESPNPWAIPWPCIYEYLRVITHPRVFDPPSDPAEAIDSLERLSRSPSLSIIGAGAGHLGKLFKMLKDSGATGNLVHDAHIATLCREHGVTELYTMDRDFSRFPGLKINRPF